MTALASKVVASLRAWTIRIRKSIHTMEIHSRRAVQLWGYTWVGPQSRPDSEQRRMNGLPGQMMCGSFGIGCRTLYLWAGLPSVSADRTLTIMINDIWEDYNLDCCSIALWILFSLLIFLNPIVLSGFMNMTHSSMSALIIAAQNSTLQRLACLLQWQACFYKRHKLNALAPSLTIRGKVIH
jgi:hypothetical protein